MINYIKSYQFFAIYCIQFEKLNNISVLTIINMFVKIMSFFSAPNGNNPLSHIMNEMSDMAKMMQKISSKWNSINSINSELSDENENTHDTGDEHSKNSMVTRKSVVTVTNDDANETKLQIELPGVLKDNVKVSFKKKTIMWSAHRQHEEQNHNGKSKFSFDFSGNYLLPYEPLEVKANLTDGMLNLTVKKPALTDDVPVNVQLE